MPIEYEEYQYDGPATLTDPDASPGQLSLQGVANVIGRIGIMMIPIRGADPVSNLLEDVSLTGYFKSSAPVPVGFAPSLRGFRQGHGAENGNLLVLTGEGKIGGNIPCTVERLKDERTFRILRTSYGST